MRRLVLASTSPFRRELLERLGLPFAAVAPAYDEQPVPGLAPGELALHHARGKAHSVAAEAPGCLVIGSDQVAELDGAVLGKPGDRAGAVRQLTAMAGRRVAFHTGLCVTDGSSEVARVERFWVWLRPLLREEIEAYVEADRPYACAGAFRIEQRGVALMRRMAGRDYTALIGLPLIALCEALRAFGVAVPPSPAGARGQLAR